MDKFSPKQKLEIGNKEFNNIRANQGILNFKIKN